jgi:flagellar biosynthetic protein FliQ
MGADQALNLSTSMLWTAIKLCAPILGISLGVSLLISIIQVVTQIQEMSLTFIPKVFVVAISLIVLGPWMLKTLTVYAASLSVICRLDRWKPWPSMRSARHEQVPELRP